MLYSQVPVLRGGTPSLTIRELASRQDLSAYTNFSSSFDTERSLGSKWMLVLSYPSLWTQDALLPQVFSPVVLLLLARNTKGEWHLLWYSVLGDPNCKRSSDERLPNIISDEMRQALGNCTTNAAAAAKFLGHEVFHLIPKGLLPPSRGSVGIQRYYPQLSGGPLSSVSLIENSKRQHALFTKIGLTKGDDLSEIACYVNGALHCLNGKNSYTLEPGIPLQVQDTESSPSVEAIEISTRWALERRVQGFQAGFEHCCTPKLPPQLRLLQNVTAPAMLISCYPSGTDTKMKELLLEASPSLLFTKWCSGDGSTSEGETHASEVLQGTWCRTLLRNGYPAQALFSSIPAGYATANDQVYRHMLVYFRRAETPEEKSMQRETPERPSAPLPKLLRGNFMEMYLFRDLGDAHFVKESLWKSNSSETLEDLLSTQHGALSVTTTPLEGTHFNDIEYLLQDHDKAKAQKLLLEDPIWEGCFTTPTWAHRLAIWRVAHVLPSNKATRETPFSGVHITVSRREPQPDGLASALRAIQFLISCATPTATGIQERTPSFRLQGIPPLESLPPDLPSCAWCYRRQVNMPRCGGCRMVHFCCPDHQKKSWSASHKSLCKLFSASMAQYKAMVEPEITKEGSELPHSEAASVANCVVRLLREMQRTGEKNLAPTAQAPIVMHVIGLESHLIEVCHALGSIVSTLQETLRSLSAPQLRILLCSPSLPDTKRNHVLAIQSDGQVCDIPPSGTFGDVWHLSPPQGQETNNIQVDAPVLLRLYDMKYHLFAQSNDLQVSKPDSLLCVGPPTGCGMKFTTAVTEVMADVYLGVIPVLCTDHNLIAACGSLQALRSRVEISSSVSGSRKLALESFLSKDPMSTISITSGDYCREIFTSPSDTTSNPNASVPSHFNLYNFFMPPQL